MIEKQHAKRMPFLFLFYEDGGGLITAAMGLNLPPTLERTPSKTPAKETAIMVNAVFLAADFFCKSVSKDVVPSM